MIEQKNTLKLYADEGGQGQPVVIFIHSLAGNSGQWQAQLQHTRQGQRAIAVDLRGHGRSPSPDGQDFSFEAMAEDLQTVIESTASRKVILVGHSMGGLVAVAYAGKYPQNVAGLLLLDPSGDSRGMPAEVVQGYMDALESDAYQGFIEGYWQQILNGAAETTIAQVMADLHATPRTTIIGSFKSLFTYDPLPALRRYEGPKLSLITPLNETPGSLHELDSDLAYEMIAGTGHWLQMDKPGVINEHLDVFLRTIKS